MTNDLTAIIWDVGGVIVNFDQTIADTKLAHNSGKTVEEVTATL